ncbi:RNA-directed DNA polymerase, eukaryota [Tanacetum coccineum]
MAAGWCFNPHVYWFRVALFRLPFVPAYKIVGKQSGWGDVVGRLLEMLDEKGKHAILYRVGYVCACKDEVTLSQVAVHADYSQAKEGTLENLLIWARNRKNDTTTFKCKVKIDGIRTRKGWNFPSCGGEKCKKGVVRREGSFWCQACEKAVEYPVLRYRLELDVSDKTASTVVVMFDEPAIELVKCTADTLASAEEDVGFGYAHDAGLPQALANIVGTIQTMEIKTQSYYEHGNFESFTCWKLAAEEIVAEDVGSTNTPPSPDENIKKSRRVLIKPGVDTPSKPTEERGKKRVDMEDSDEEATCDLDDDEADVEGQSGSAIKKKRGTLWMSLHLSNYGQWHASSTKTDIECISIHDLVDIVDSFNMDLPVPSLSNLFSNAINVYSRTTITRDGNVQSFCGLKLTNIDMQGSAGQLPGANPERTSEKRKNIASTSRQPLNTPQSYITDRRQRRASATMPKQAALTSVGTLVSYCNLGPPSYVCRNCNAQMWYEERTNKGNRATNPSFSLCCQEDAEHGCRFTTLIRERNKRHIRFFDQY